MYISINTNADWLRNLLYFIFKSYHLSEFNFIFRVYKIIMRALITGGAGYIGSTVSNLLLDNGHQVYIIDNAK